MEKSCCRIANAYIQSGRIANPTERNYCVQNGLINAVVQP